MTATSSSTKEGNEDPFLNFAIRVPDNYTPYNFNDLFTDQEETTVCPKQFKALKEEVETLKKKNISLQSELDRRKIEAATTKMTMEASIKTLEKKVAVLETNKASVQNQIDGLVQSLKELRGQLGTLQKGVVVVDDNEERCVAAPVPIKRGDDVKIKLAPDKVKEEDHLRYQEGLPFECPICKIKFPTKGELNKHMSDHHNTKKPSHFACKVCSKSFVDIRELHKHLAKHGSKAYHLCEHCGKQFGLERTLRLHLKVHHNINAKGGQKEENCDEVRIEEDNGGGKVIASVQSHKEFDSQDYIVKKVSASKKGKIVRRKGTTNVRTKK